MHNAAKIDEKHISKLMLYCNFHWLVQADMRYCVLQVNVYLYANWISCFHIHTHSHTKEANNSISFLQVAWLLLLPLLFLANKSLHQSVCRKLTNLLQIEIKKKLIFNCSIRYVRFFIILYFFSLFYISFTVIIYTN